MNAIACKFGGTSLADATAIRKAMDIVRADPDRRYVVPSAPGKRFAEDRKVTDILYAWAHMLADGFDATEPRAIIRQRFISLVDELQVDLDVDAELVRISEESAHYTTPDYLASRGEYLSGKVVAAYLGATFVDPAECIRFDEAGALDLITYRLLAERLQGEGRFVIPGFYGATKDGRIRTFSRGGSDITGSIIARAAGARLYENWTDVSGFRMTDPRIVPDARHIAEVTYQELRELSYMGATVLHDEAIFPVRELGIPINIRNTNEPDHPGTNIVPKRIANQAVCGIAGRKGFTMINIEKAFMNKQRGFGRRVLSVLEEHGVGWEHMPTGIDTISLIIRNEELGDKGPALIKEINRVCEPDEVSLAPGLAIIATVGIGMNQRVGVAARLCTAMADAGINIRVIDQGSSEMNLIVGVEDVDFERSIRAIYDAFADWT